MAKDQPLRVVLIGTDFEVRVWEKLLDIPWAGSPPIPTSPPKPGRRRPRAPWRSGRQEPDLLRGALPPVIGKNGDITGYHWGLTRKRAMLGWEAGMAAAA